ncbi:hypothetical protein [Actinoplanes awajinensis]|uniref:Uncharacterized protein n=1 Tax=Actinoplanes awajinensis subsp. mycoplanecinus TaxID=135947 RepID=A0A117MJW3_9ACTN|nr:hypothetical protein [Actinoplanes awajinensis]KUL21431.1 hypothetical protein ADL15_50795 [Actinoplanes awajinensis subsp. mycoplanecinus]
MTRPDGPFDDRTPPVDPWATVDRPVPTVYLGDPDATASFSGSNRTTRLPAPDPGPQVSPSASTVHLPADDNPTVRAAGELRFGPGVPVAPQPTPAWPAAAPAKRPRPVWRRLVSVLSSLLTLALVVVAGFYLWQRLRPLEVESVTVAVPRPAGTRCNVTVDVVATVHTNGRSGVLRYQWFRTDAEPGTMLTEQIGTGQRTAALTLHWTFDGTGRTTETATLNLIEPSPIQAGTKVAYNCRRG